MKRFATVVALVLGGCAGDPMVACEEAEADLVAWQCDECPGTAWCPESPDTRPSLCSGTAETLDLAAVQLRCRLECYQERVGEGDNVCPPHEAGADWIGKYGTCLAECTGGGL